MGLFLEAGKLDRVPVMLITGFLGSGKTTLLNRLLVQDAMRNSAVIVNEFGDVPLDQEFIEKKEDDVLVLPNGCLCCTAQGDFEGVMGSLFGRRGTGEVAPFDRMVIETTGIADPTSIIQLLLASPLIVPNFALDSVVTTVDAAHAKRQLADHAEALTQVAAADRLVITKSDLVPAGTLDALKLELQSLNPTAGVLVADHGHVPATALLGAADPEREDVAPWLERIERIERSAPTHAGGGVTSFSLLSSRPVRWQRFNRWLTEVRIRHSEQLLRVKGLVHVEGEDRPVAVHGVHHLFHPPVRLERPFGEDARTRLVFIVRGDLRQEIGRSWLEMLIEANAEEGNP